MSGMDDDTTVPGPARPRRRRRAERFAGTTTGTVIWQGGARNRLQWVASLLGAGVVALGVFIALEPAVDVLATNLAVAGCLAAGLLVMAGTIAFAKVRVRIDGECVEVRCGHLGLPRRRIPLKQVLDCRHADVTPRHWGGYGARWRPERGDAVVVRRGPALELELGSGKRFTVTVDDAQAAHEALRSVLDSGRTQPNHV
jgi:hypothetical protein